MIFEQEHLQFQLLDVLYFNELNVELKTRPRPFCAISLRTEGETVIELRDQTILLRERDLAFFPSNVGYHRRSQMDKRIVIHFNLLNSAPYDIEVLHDVRYDTIAPIFEDALATWEARSPGYVYHVSSLLYRIFEEVRLAEPVAERHYSNVVESALALIRERYGDPALTVEQLAEWVHTSETNFRNRFHQEIGVNPKHYLSDYRLEHAQSLLNAGYDSVAQVAAKVGFRDTKNFATAFRKRFGYPPSGQHYEFTE